MMSLQIPRSELISELWICENGRPEIGLKKEVFEWHLRNPDVINVIGGKQRIFLGSAVIDQA